MATGRGTRANLQMHVVQWQTLADGDSFLFSLLLPEIIVIVLLIELIGVVVGRVHLIITIIIIITNLTNIFSYEQYVHNETYEALVGCLR